MFAGGYPRCMWEVIPKVVCGKLSQLFCGRLSQIIEGGYPSLSVGGYPSCLKGGSPSCCAQIHDWCFIACLGMSGSELIGATEWGRSSAQFVHLVFVFVVGAMDEALLELVNADCVTLKRNEAFRSRVVTFLVE